MSRLETRFAALRAAGRKALIPYLVAGDPKPAVTVDLMHALVAAGADVIELGVPFSDPMAEGPVIQLAHERALEHATSLSDCLGLVQQFRTNDSDTPVVLMGYANPIEAMGYQVFAERAADAGVDGVLTVDLPPEEGGELDAYLRERGLNTICLIAPTTTAERIAAICAHASGFVYYVSLKGVTGAAHLDSAEVATKVEQVKACTELPVCVGFGIRDAASARAVAAVADGAVVGSALVSAIAQAAGDGELQPQSAVQLIAQMRQAIDA